MGSTKLRLSSFYSMYKPLAEYGIIGNCRSCALVSDEASIDWACLPNFDSGAYFCKILDSEKGGFFQIAPTEGFYQSNQQYKRSTKGVSQQAIDPNQTNILKTFFFNQSGTVVVTDFMPITQKQDLENDIPEFGLKIVRKVKAITGNHAMTLTLKVTPDFARDKPTIIKKRDHVVIEDSNVKLVLHTPYLVHLKDNLLTVQFHLKEGEDVFFGLSFLQKETKLQPVSQSAFHKIYAETEEYWEWWMSKCTYEGEYRDAIQRSALALKLLIFEPTGAIVAAATTSIPEKVGGSFNWDYRFTWLRDASFTVYALLGLGYIGEAENFIRWLETVCLKEESIPKIMYGIHGEKELHERELNHLSGYLNSKPVRIGNGAANQKQFDIFGEVLTAIDLYVSAGGSLNPEMQRFVKRLIDYCCTHWKEPDAGIWEERGGDQHHTYSKLMCWAGVDRGIKIAEKLKFEADLPHWKKVKEQIKDDILEHGYNKEIESFVDTYGSKIIDASALNIPIVGLLPASDKRVLSTMNQVMKNLVIDWFVLRTSNQEDELKQGEGAFFLSTFWLIDCLSILGRTAEAKVWLEKIIHDGTPLGLYAEELDPYTKHHLGNFPQAFTHLGLINSVLNLEKAKMFGLEKNATSPSDRLSEVISSLIPKYFGNHRGRRLVKLFKLFTTSNDS